MYCQSFLQKLQIWEIILKLHILLVLQKLQIWEWYYNYPGLHSFANSKTVLLSSSQFKIICQSVCLFLYSFLQNDWTNWPPYSHLFTKKQLKTNCTINDSRWIKFKSHLLRLSNITKFWCCGEAKKSLSLITFCSTLKTHIIGIFWTTPFHLYNYTSMLEKCFFCIHLDTLFLVSRHKVQSL